MKIRLENANRFNIRNALERLQQKQREAKQAETEINEIIKDIAKRDDIDADNYTWRIDSAECLYLEGKENAST